MQKNAPSEWVLYVGHGKKRRQQYEHGSILCMRIIEALGLQSAVIVQDCDALRAQGVEFPEWLTGTPTLIGREHMTKYSGSEAILQLCVISNTSKERSAGVDHSSSRMAERSREQQMQPAQSARVARMQVRDPSPRDTRDEVVPLNHDEHDDMSGDLENILTNPQGESTSSSRRITDDDVQRYMAERKRFDDRQKQSQQQR